MRPLMWAHAMNDFVHVHVITCMYQVQLRVERVFQRLVILKHLECYSSMLLLCIATEPVLMLTIQACHLVLE